MQCEPKVHVNALNEVARQPAKRLHTIPLRIFFPFLYTLRLPQENWKNVRVQLTAFVWKSEQRDYLLRSWRFDENTKNIDKFNTELELAAVLCIMTKIGQRTVSPTPPTVPEIKKWSRTNWYWILGGWDKPPKIPYPKNMLTVLGHIKGKPLNQQWGKPVALLCH